MREGRNFFGDPVYSPLEVFANGGDPVLRDFIRRQLEPAVSEYDVAFEGLEGVLVEAAARIRGATTAAIEREEHCVESRLRAQFSGARAEAIRAGSLLPRARTCASQVAHFLDACDTFRGRRFDTLLDVGCGDGLIASLLTQQFAGAAASHVWLADTINYLDPDVESAFPDRFIALEPGYERFAAPAGTRARRYFDADLVLLLTVLHHASAPSRVLRACWEAMRRSGGGPAALVIIESCVGIDAATLERYPCGPEVSENPRVDEFVALGADRQRLYATFIDWFYNRVVHTNVHVPCNFRTPDQWNVLLNTFRGFHVLTTALLGFDQPIVPEFHTIHVVAAS